MEDPTALVVDTIEGPETKTFTDQLIPLIQFGTPVAQYKGGKFVPIFVAADEKRGDLKSPLCIILPPLSVAFKPSVYNDDKTGNRVSVDLDFKAAMHNKSAKNAYDLLTALDRHVEGAIVDNRDVWVPGFKRSGPAKKTDEEVAATYLRVTRMRTSETSDRAWPPRLSVQGKDAKVFSGKEKPASGVETPVDIPLIDLIEKDTVVRSMIVCNGLSIRDQKISLSWKAIQLRTLPSLKIDQSLSDVQAFGHSMEAGNAGQEEAQEFVKKATSNKRVLIKKKC